MSNIAHRLRFSISKGVNKIGDVLPPGAPEGGGNQPYHFSGRDFSWKFEKIGANIENMFKKVKKLSPLHGENEKEDPF